MNAPLSSILLVLVGGGTGAVARYLISICKFKNTTLPIQTLFVNLLGCFIIGILFQIQEQYTVKKWLNPLMVIGFLGGFTTFSTFSLETVKLINASKYISAAIYILSSNILGIILVICGIKFAKYF